MQFHRCPGRDRNESISEPFLTVTGARRGEKALVSPTPIQTGYGERDYQAPRVPGLDKPLGTIVAGGGKHALVAAHITRFNQNGVGQSADEPLGTAMAERRALGCAPRFFHANSEAPSVMPRDEPLGSTTAGGGGEVLVSAFLAQHNLGVIGHAADEPVSTITMRAVSSRSLPRIS